MTHVKCSVTSCSYNQDGGCYVSTVKIGGRGATQEGLTCCGSFLNRQHYSNIAEYTSQRSEAESVMCNVTTCRYNSDEHCSRDGIHVNGSREAEIYTETYCDSFDKES